jgi:hypothetical protein
MGETEGWKNSNVEAQLSKDFTKGETEKKYIFFEKPTKKTQVKPG